MSKYKKPILWMDAGFPPPQAGEEKSLFQARVSSITAKRGKRELFIYE
ncbi:hypothetical protein MNBD_ALPHA06-2324 [hydrothermal vent metagenome]|uniref:Uncharacterized protein n=1 Tax=hydrothermal vent metagenome TaxID=652676 RepID=A0A3B0RYM6_9ZZZZ